MTYNYELLGKTYKVSLEFGKYNNGKLFLGLKTPREPFMDITVNIPAFGLRCLDQNEVIVKNYSENEGLDKWLIANNIATPTGETIESNWVRVPVMKLSDEVYAQAIKFCKRYSL